MAQINSCREFHDLSYKKILRMIFQNSLRKFSFLYRLAEIQKMSELIKVLPKKTKKEQMMTEETAIDNGWHEYDGIGRDNSCHSIHVYRSDFFGSFA